MLRRLTLLSTSLTCEFIIFSRKVPRSNTSSFDGEVVTPETLEDPKKREAFDIMAFLGRNGKDVRFPTIAAVAKDLKKEYKKVGAIGFCYGGWVRNTNLRLRLHLAYDQRIGCLPAGLKGQQARRRHLHRTPFAAHKGRD